MQSKLMTLHNRRKLRWISNLAGHFLPNVVCSKRGGGGGGGGEGGGGGGGPPAPPKNATRVVTCLLMATLKHERFSFLKRKKIEQQQWIVCKERNFFCRDFFPTKKNRKSFGERKLVMHFFLFHFSGKRLLWCPILCSQWRRDLLFNARRPIYRPRFANFETKLDGNFISNIFNHRNSRGVLLWYLVNNWNYIKIL